MSEERAYKVDDEHFVCGEKLMAVPLHGTLFVDGSDLPHRMTMSVEEGSATLQFYAANGGWKDTPYLELPIYALRPAPLKAKSGSELRKWLVNNSWLEVHCGDYRLRWNPEECTFEFRRVRSLEWKQSLVTPGGEAVPTRGYW